MTLLLIQNFVSIQNMPIIQTSDDHKMRQGCLIKIRWILLWRIQNSSCNSETIWGQYGLKCLLLVYFHSNIILKMHFVSWGCLEAVFTKTWFCSKTKVSQTLASSLNNIGGQWNFFDANLFSSTVPTSILRTITSNSQIPGNGWILCAPEQNSPHLD